MAHDLGHRDAGHARSKACDKAPGPRPPRTADQRTRTRLADYGATCRRGRTAGGAARWFTPPAAGGRLGWCDGEVWSLAPSSSQNRRISSGMLVAVTLGLLALWSCPWRGGQCGAAALAVSHFCLIFPKCQMDMSMAQVTTKIPTMTNPAWLMLKVPMKVQNPPARP